MITSHCDGISLFVMRKNASFTGVFFVVKLGKSLEKNHYLSLSYWYGSHQRIVDLSADCVIIFENRYVWIG